MRFFGLCVCALFMAPVSAVAAEDTSGPLDASELLATTFVPEHIEVSGLRLEMDGHKVEGGLMEKDALLNRALYHSPASADLLRKRNNRLVAGTLVGLAGAGLTVAGAMTLDRSNDAAAFGLVGGGMGLLTTGFVVNLTAPTQRKMIGSYNQWSDDTPAALR